MYMWCDKLYQSMNDSLSIVPIMITVLQLISMYIYDVYRWLYHSYWSIMLLKTSIHRDSKLLSSSSQVAFHYLVCHVMLSLRWTMFRRRQIDSAFQCILYHMIKSPLGDDQRPDAQHLSINNDGRLMSNGRRRAGRWGDQYNEDWFDHESVVNMCILVIKAVVSHFLSP